MTHPSQIERITRSLAYMLRHKPEEFDIELDRYGAADCSEVVQVLNERLGEPIEEEDLHEAIEGGDRTRYEIRKGRIRALYGHSIDVDAGESCKPPELLYVGLGSRDAERAENYGLRAGRRRFLHLAKSFEEALETGRRQARTYAVVTVYALDAWEQGVNFFDRVSLFLSDPIPTEFLEVGEFHDDGHPRQDDRSRPRRGRSDGPRTRERVGRRLDGDRDRDREPAAVRERSERDGGSRDREGSRPERDDRPRGRDERPARGDRPRQRDERPARSSDESRPSSRRPAEDREPRRRSAPAPTPSEAPRESKPEPAPAASNSSAFGLGLFQDEVKPQPKAVQQTPQPEPPRPEPEPEPEPKPAPGPAFGDGL